MFTRESLDKLRDRIDLLEVVSTHVEMKRVGAVYKGLCPFHQEKNPSFIIQKSDTHYHCYGCGAHGDAIQFLMELLNLNFVDAVESLAERFHLHLERQDQHEKGADKNALKEICSLACQYFHSTLLYTEEGREALHYLFKRGLNLDFINRFEVGYAPSDGTKLKKILQDEKTSVSQWVESGLFVEGGSRPFFRDRITFPIRNAAGAVIGFSARKYKDETFGGKYINTPETPLFKKSRILFGLNYSRRRIAKERRVLIVEGQIDCLKLIEAGLNLTVAALGTAFGESHCDELKKIGIRIAYLLFDGDEAGCAAASKIGNLLQKRGIEVFVTIFPKGSDPDAFLTQYGINRLIDQMEHSKTYLAFQIDYLSREISKESPAGKAELVKILKKQITEWEEPVMIHESLRKIAALIRVPDEMIGLTNEPPHHPILFKNPSTITINPIDPHRILELDLLRWVVLMGETFFPTVKHYLTEKHFLTPICGQLFQKILAEGKTDLLSLACVCEDSTIIDEILKKKVNRERAEAHFLETVQKILDREWMQIREKIKMEIQSGNHSEEKVLELVKQFDALKTHRPIATFIRS